MSTETKPTPKPGLERAIRAADGITAFSRRLNLRSHSVVQQWRLHRVPAEYCPLIELHWGVPCEELRDDIRWDVVRSRPQPVAQAVTADT